MSAAVRELEHPADIFLEIRGRDPDELFENALYALYSQMVDLAAVGDNQGLVVRVQGSSLEDALRALLAEALYRFETQGFAAGKAKVKVRVKVSVPGDRTGASSGTANAGGGPTQGSDGAGPAAGEGVANTVIDASTGRGRVKVTANLWGGRPVSRDSVLTEVKAVTYHRLSVLRDPAGLWRATVLFDV